MEVAVQTTEMVNSILNIVKYHFKMDLDENSVNYGRFLTHLRFFSIRFARKEKLEETVDSFFYEQIMLKYPDAYASRNRINTCLDKHFKGGLTMDDEVH